MTTAELILYATPAGPLADELAGVYELISRTQPTTAQDYPPHCTLTGFFHRDADDIARIVTEIRDTLAAADPRPSDAVAVAALHQRSDWVGLEINSPWLAGVTEQFVRRHTLNDGDDPLRPKDWLHVSIGYGSGHGPHTIAATREFDHTLSATWDVGLWRRFADGSFSRLGFDD